MDRTIKFYSEEEVSRGGVTSIEMVTDTMIPETASFNKDILTENNKFLYLINTGLLDYPTFYSTSPDSYMVTEELTLDSTIKPSGPSGSEKPIEVNPGGGTK
jgi:ATP-dependent Zn protease